MNKFCVKILVTMLFISQVSAFFYRKNNKKRNAQQYIHHYKPDINHIQKRILLNRLLFVCPNDSCDKPLSFKEFYINNNNTVDCHSEYLPILISITLTDLSSVKQPAFLSRENVVSKTQSTSTICENFKK